MARLTRTLRILVLLILLVFVSLHLLSVVVQRRTARGEDFSALDRAVLAAYQPFYNAFTWPFRAAIRVWRGYVALVGVRAENERLREEVQRKEAELTQMTELRHEVQELRGYLDFTERTGTPLTMARVVGRSFLPGLATILVGRGTADGVQAGMLAVTPAGLAGHVTGAARSVARVRLLSDPLSAVHVIDQRSRATGVVKGSPEGVLRLAYTKWSDDVQPGDVLVTSGQDLFPKGVQVGRVAQVSRQDAGAEREVVVEPSADLAHLEYVALVPAEEFRTEAETFEEFAPPPPEAQTP